MLKQLDRFGVDLPLRIKNYEKFTTNTGGFIFLIYLIGIICYFIYGIINYFTDPYFDIKFSEKDFYNNEINLENQSFHFAIFDFEKSIGYNHTRIKSYYYKDNKLTNIPQKTCQKNEFNFEGHLNYTNPDLICFDNKANETITGDTFPRKQIKYEILPGANKTTTNKSIKFVYSINTYQARKGEILGFNNIKIDEGLHYNYNIYLEKSIYEYDFGSFYQNMLSNSITNFFRYTIVTQQRNKTDYNAPLITITLKQHNIIKEIFGTRKRLYVVILEMMSMATTLLSNIRAIVSILNRKKAKQNIFENIFHINSYEKNEINIQKINIPNEIEIQKINIPNENNINNIPNENNENNENNLKDISERRNLQAFKYDKTDLFNDNYDNNYDNYYKKDDLFPKNDEILFDIEPIEKRMERIQEILKKNKTERIQREFYGIKNEIEARSYRNQIAQNNNNDLIDISINENIKKEENELKEAKEINEKMNMILKNYPTIKNNDGYKKDPRTVRNIFSYLYLLLTCKKKRLKQVNSLTDIIDREFAESMNIYNFIKREKNLIVVENILFNQDEKMLLDFISMPLINLEKDEKPFVKKLDNYEYMLVKYSNLQRKNNKTDIEKKLIDSFKNKISNN